jgi:NADH-quinone oxidoreductase subunit J
MTLAFAIIASITLASAIAAIMLRNLVHCALSLTLTFAGLAALYLQLNAQFVGFAQILVYVGAVAILIVFAILLTREIDSGEQRLFSSSWKGGVVVAVAVFAVLTYAVASSLVLKRPPTTEPEFTVRQLGQELMTQYVLPLEVIGLLLTAALIGAVIIAMHEKEAK